MLPISENHCRYVEDLNDARTLLADFINRLLIVRAEKALIPIEERLGKK